MFRGRTEDNKYDELMINLMIKLMIMSYDEIHDNTCDKHVIKPYDKT